MLKNEFKLKIIHIVLDKRHEKKLKKLLPSATCIGYINNSNKVTYLENGKTKKVKYNGYNHF